jgi:hypothetical protein
MGFIFLHIIPVDFHSANFYNKSKRMFVSWGEIMGKIFVELTAKHCIDGKIKPLAINWSDGRTFEIDKIMDMRMAGSLKGGGQGMRYTCRIRNKTFFLFHDEEHWFIETDKV